MSNYCVKLEKFAHDKFKETGHPFIVFNQTLLTKVDIDKRIEAKFAGSFKTKEEAFVFMEKSHCNPWLYQIKVNDCDDSVICVGDFQDNSDESDNEWEEYGEEQE